MYNPVSGNDNEEYIELHNRSSVAQQVGGWRISDGIEFEIPEETLWDAPFT